MTDPIYPDKTKTGLAALKPLTDAFFAEPERWVWEVENRLSSSPNPPNWREVSIGMALVEIQTYGMDGVTARLTPKPRRVWIGDQSYPEPLRDCWHYQSIYVADISIDRLISVNFDQNDNKHIRWQVTGFIFGTAKHAQQCLDAYRKARRIE